jgi:4-hydroxy-2-oxoheptanedioate aldolase
VRPNKIKQMWRDGKFVTLGWLSVSHGFTAEVMARQGFDALCVDMQHGTTDMNDVWPMLQAISQTDTVPVVRVPWNEPPTIMKALDLGAYAIIVPLINTADDAAKAVAACRYPPVGMRSSGPVRAVHYGGADYLAKANDEIVVMAMIETKEGLANLDKICATPGLDAVYIGPADLSFALGLAPRGDNPEPVHLAYLRQDPRCGAQARHQGGHALRERGVRRRRREARLRHGHAHLGPGLDDRGRPPAARRSEGRDRVSVVRVGRRRGPR